MKTETVDKIVAAAETIGVEIEAYRGYSGRAMYGDRTDGITYGKLGDFLAAIALAAGTIADNHGAFGDETDAFIADLQTARTDNLGRDTIVY